MMKNPPGIHTADRLFAIGWSREAIQTRLRHLPQQVKRP